MRRSSRSASDGRFDSATSLTSSYQYSGRNPSAGPDSPVDYGVAKPAAPYSALKLSHPTVTGSYLSPRFLDTSKSIYSRLHPSRCLNKVVSLPGSSLASPTYLSSDDALSWASSDALAGGTANIMSCEACSTPFTGKYARGNLGRHMRQYHTQAARSSFECLVDGCPKVYARQDARLKHYRTHHSELDLSSITSIIHPGEVPVSIQTALCSIRTNLDEETFTRVCDMFLYIFSAIVQYLRDTGSNTYDVFMDVLEDIDLVVDDIESGSTDSVSQGMADRALVSRPHHSGAASSNEGRGYMMNLSQSSMSRADSSHPPKGQKTTHDQKHGSHKVAESHPNKSPPSKLVDCPDHKHWMMNTDPQKPSPPCHGCCGENMSQVRHHLMRTKHPGRRGMWRCPICKKHFEDGRSRREHAGARSCQSQMEYRGDIVKPWAMLYLARYPKAKSIPSPYCDETGYLPQPIFEEFLACFEDTPAPIQNTTKILPDTTAVPPNTTAVLPGTTEPFPGHTENVRRDQDHEIMHANNNLAAHRATIQVAIQTLKSIHSSMSNNPSTTPTEGSTVGFNGNHQTGPSPTSYDTVVWDNVRLYNIGLNLSSVANSLMSQSPGALHVDMGQISPIANEAEMIVNSMPVHDQCQLPHVQAQGQDDSNSAANLPPVFALGSSNIEMSNLWTQQHETFQNIDFHTPHNMQYSTTTLSTRSSQTDMPTSSYLTQPSPVTNPSSAHGTTDEMRFSAPNSPYHHRRRSGNSEVSDRPFPLSTQRHRDSLLGTDSQFDYSQSTETGMSHPFGLQYTDPRRLTLPRDHRHQYADTPNVAINNLRCISCGALFSFPAASFECNCPLVSFP